MRIFWNELKKLLNWRLLLILAVFTGLYYFMFLNFYLIDYPTTGHPRAESVELGRRMAVKYGPSLDTAEQKTFESVDYPALKAAANRELAEMREFRDAKITTVDAFDALREETDDASQKLSNRLSDVWNKRISNRPDAVFLYQAARDEVISEIDTLRKTTPQERVSSELSGTQRERIFTVETRRSEQGIPILPWPTQGIWGYLQNYFLTLLLVTAAVLVSPYLVGERRSGVHGIAYASRKGRPLLRAQFGAALVAAALAETAQFAVFFAAFFLGPHRVDRLFFGADVSNGCWFDVTFGQYIAGSCAILFLLAFAFAMVSFAVSKICKNYIAVLAAQIPLTFLAAKLGGSVLSNPLTVYRSPYFMPLACVLCAAVPLAVCLFLIWRERRTDFAE